MSLQLGHRMSDDIDLFTRRDINKDEILDFLNQNYAVKLLHDKLSVNKIKQRLIDEMNNYNENIIGNN